MTAPLRRRRSLAALAIPVVFLGADLSIWGGPPARAQVRPIYSRGLAGLLQEIRRLNTTASALHTGAHPDDEDTAFIARTARGDHGRVAYLSLNRGEGGQNVIGPELLEPLGVIRTEELLQARTLDGGEQFFTRTFDFGFSKSPEEAAARWGEEEVLADMVQVIRAFRPLVVYSGFSGTAADGHGQHQLLGRLTPIAFRAAADPARFPEQIAAGLRPWRALKIYAREAFRPDPARPATMRLQTGGYDPALGRSYFEIAMEGRSQHKSQQMGMPELHGPQASPLRLLESLVPTPPAETSVFDGIDTSILGLAGLAGLPDGVLGGALALVQSAVRRSIAAFDVAAPAAVVPALAEGLREVRAARLALGSDGERGTEAARADADFLLAVKERQFESALANAAGLVIDPIADTDTVAPGESLGVSVRFFHVDPSLVSVSGVELHAPDGWKVTRGEAKEIESGTPLQRFFRERPDRADHFDVAVPSGTAYTRPYWLMLPRDGDLFRWPEGAPATLPFGRPPLTARVDLSIGGIPLSMERPVEYRLVDQVRGELRRRIDVVPALSVSLDSKLEIVPASARGLPRRVAVRLQSGARTAMAGTLHLAVPDGWSASPERAEFTIARKGERVAIGFTVTPAAAATPGRYRIGAVADVNGRTFDVERRTIAYPHIQTHYLYQPAEAQARVLDLQVAPVRVAYVMGSGDAVPEAIRRMGLAVDLLDDDWLVSGDLSGFDVVVVGVRASEARPAFVANHGRLLAFVRDGGTLIVQYQQPDYAARGLPPFPAEIGSRVTVEEAAVRVLVPHHPAFTLPNRITAEDWEGWVQERNLYAFRTFAPEYIPTLETGDPGEPPQRGGQVIAELGRGLYVYTSYSWFRQLPAGVPGAYRLFANLLSLPKTMGRTSAARRSAAGAGGSAPGRGRLRPVVDREAAAPGRIPPSRM